MFLAALAGMLLLLSDRSTEPDEQGQPAELMAEGAAPAGRKNIYDRDLREMAVSLQLTSVYARPLELREPEMIASQFAALLEQDEQELLSALRSERSFVWLARRLDAERSARITGLRAKGLYFLEEEQRFYPYRETGAHVLGFLGKEQGLAGVEFHYEQLLQGVRDLERGLLPSLPAAVDTKKGVDLVLTLDLSVQAFLEQELAVLKKQTGAAAAMALVMEPASGEVHALVSLPGFDPNLFWRYSTAERRNRVLVDPLFPGGLWKLFRLAGAAEAGQEVVAEEEAEDAPLLEARKAKRKQTSAGPLHGDWLELAPGVHVTPSLAKLPDFDPGAAKIASLAARLGLAGPLNIDLPKGTENGEVWPQPAPGTELDLFSSVTGIQFLAAFNQLLGAGETVKPHLLKAILDPQRQEVPLRYERQPPRVEPKARQAFSDLLSGAGGGPAMFESLIFRPVEPETGEVAPGTCRQQNVLLGITSGEAPLSFLLVLDEACIDPGRPSGLRALGQRFARQVDRLQQEDSGKAATSGGRSAEMQRRWRDLHQAADQGAETLAPRSDRMADVRGLGVRQALQALQAYGLPVEISGSGRVVGQQPQAGSSLVGAGEIRLELRSDE